MPVPEGRTGNHREQGFLLARGPAFREGAGRYQGNILQIAPTLLRLHGVQIPAQFEMGILQEIFADEPVAKAS
jgi:predicted AlkP superfamily phosphohydrolase/phosphomutase